MSQPCVVLSEGKTSMFFLMFATVSQFNQWCVLGPRVEWD
jgi:hypothetical protein